MVSLFIVGSSFVEVIEINKMMFLEVMYIVVIVRVEYCFINFWFFILKRVFKKIVNNIMRFLVSVWFGRFCFLKKFLENVVIMLLIVKLILSIFVGCNCLVFVNILIIKVIIGIKVIIKVVWSVVVKFNVVLKS